MGWDTFWAIFSQTHLVTLRAIDDECSKLVFTFPTCCCKKVVAETFPEEVAIEQGNRFKPHLHREAQLCIREALKTRSFTDWTCFWVKVSL
jgi:hypothetical protein